MGIFRVAPLLALFVAPCALMADAIPYGPIGAVAPVTTLTAAATGDVIGYFLNGFAGGSDYVRLLDTTSGRASLFGLDNQTSAPGTAMNFGPVTAGDNLVFELVNSDVETSDGYTYFANLGPIDPNARTNQYLLTSDPAYSVDGVNHAYVTAFSGSSALGIPPGTYVGMEDLPAQFADFDYNDTNFVFTDVASTAVTPEPGSFWLIATGALGMVGAARRRLLRKA